MVFIENATKGLFAEAERFEHGDDRLGLTLVAAHIALSRGLVHRSDGYGNLSDIESFLRQSGSNMYLIAMPRTADLAARRPHASYSWLPKPDRHVEGEPNYFAVISNTDEGTEFAHHYHGVTAKENLYRLGYTGMPELGRVKDFEEHLLHFVPPRFITDEKSGQL